MNLFGDSRIIDLIRRNSRRQHIVRFETLPNLDLENPMQANKVKREGKIRYAAAAWLIGLPIPFIILAWLIGGISW